MLNKEENIEWVTDGEIGILKINNPPQNYLINPEFINIETLQEKLAGDIKGLVISGNGRHFSAGADLENIFNKTEKPEELKLNLIKGNKLLNYIENLEIPVIATISGVCFGGGFEIALACHIRVCTETSLFAFPEINSDLIPGMGGLQRMEKLTGKATTLELAFSGDTINASKAYDLKLVDYITEKNKALEFSVDLLKNIIKDRPLKVINMIMKSINNSNKMDIEKAMENDAEMFCELAVEEAKRRNNR
ncbi:MAG: hypothetical protein B6D61_12580 [Bacteroidetes bacterium 4484_249]|nr:MAG: hypothetical protein B6D61_12580 [Bacteroidetes bacterium 4484_249]